MVLLRGSYKKHQKKRVITGTGTLSGFKKFYMSLSERGTIANRVKRKITFFFCLASISQVLGQINKKIKAR